MTEDKGFNNQLDSALLRLVCEKHGGKVCVANGRAVTKECLLNEIESLLHETPRIPLERVALQLKVDSLDILKFLNDGYKELGVVGGDLVNRELFIAEIRPLIEAELRDFVSLQILSEKFKLPAVWLKQNVLSCFPVFVHNKVEYYCLPKVLDALADRIETVLTEPKEPVDIYEYATQRLGFIPQTAFSHLLSQKEIVEYGKFVNGKQFIPARYLAWQLDEANRQLSNNHFIDERYCQSILHLNKKEILEFIVSNFSSHYILKEYLFVFDQVLLDDISSRCIAWLQEGNCKSFSMPFQFSDDLYAQIIKVAKLDEYILIKNGQCFSKIVLVAEDKKGDLTERDIKSCATKLKTSKSQLIMNGFRTIKQFNLNVGHTLEQTYLLNNQITKTNPDVFYTSFLFKKRCLQLINIVKVSDELPIVLHASLELFLMKHFEHTLFEFTGKFIPELLTTFKGTLEFPVEFMQAKEAISKREKDVSQLLIKLKALIR